MDAALKPHYNEIKLAMKTSSQPISSTHLSQTAEKYCCDEKWERISKKLRSKLGEDIYTSWFLSVEVESIETGIVTLSTATRFLRNWILSHFKDQLIRLWEEEVGAVHRLDIRVRGALRGKNNAIDHCHENAHNETKPKLHSDQNAHNNGHQQSANSKPFIKRDLYQKQKLPQLNGTSATHSNAAHQTHHQTTLLHSISSSLDLRYTFDSFCASDTNRIAFEAARFIAMAEPNDPALYNPLYFHGGVGLGKTHLLQAIANQMHTQQKNRVVYLTAERFMGNFVQALRHEKALQFKDELRNIDVLLIDDMQFLTGKAIQQEFCHMLNALIDSRKQVVVAADRPACELNTLEERVRSRLQGGVAVKIAPPDHQLRQQILTKRYEILSKHSNVVIPNTVIEYIASAITTNGRDLEGAFNRIVCHAQMSSEPISIQAVERALSDLIGKREPRRVRIEDIQKTVAQHYNVSRAELLSARRTRTIVLPRQVAMYLAKLSTPRSLPEIGRRFGNRDHTTVLHAVRKIEDLMKKDENFTQDIELLQRIVEQ